MKNYAEFWMLLACSYEEIAEAGRHSFLGPQPTDTVLADGQRTSKEAIPFDSKPGKFCPDDKLLTFLNQL